MHQTGWRQQFFLISLCVLAFAISMPFLYGSLAIMLVCLAWAVQGGFPGKLKHLFSFGYLIWILYYVLHLVSYTYSTNKSESAFDLQSKMSFFILPIVIGTGARLDKKQLEKIFFTYVLGITASAIYCMGKAIILYQQTHKAAYFFYHTLVKGLETNAIYIAWFTIFSLFLLLFFGWENFFKGKRSIWKWLLFSLQMVFFILLSSRLLIALFFVLLVPAGYYIYFRQKKISSLKKIITVVSVAALACGIFFTSNPVKQRYKDVEQNNFKQLFEKDYTNKSLQLNNLTIRLFVWRVSLQNIKEQNLWLKGCGNGSVHDLQNRKMKELGLSDFQNEHPISGLYNMNLHNMYLQTLMMLGIPGLIVFLMIVFSPFFFMKYVPGKIVFILFQVTCAFFMFQEAALQTQAGIVFFTFFSQLFWNLRYVSPKERD
jgi:O-antigen ligase